MKINNNNQTKKDLETGTSATRWLDYEFNIWPIPAIKFAR